MVLNLRIKHASYILIFNIVYYMLVEVCIVNINGEEKNSLTSNNVQWCLVTVLNSASKFHFNTFFVI